MFCPIANSVSSIAAASIVVLAGCASPLVPVDPNSIYKSLMVESKKLCSRSQDDLYRDDSPQAERAKNFMGLAFQIDGSRWRSVDRSARLTTEDYYYSHLGLRAFDSGDIPTHVFRSSGPVAYICPHGDAYISDFFLDTDGPGHLTDNEMFALFAHELAHFRDAHVFMQRWAAQERDKSRAQGNANVALSWASKILSNGVGGRLPVSVNYSVPDTHNDNDLISVNALYFPLEIEHAADSEAIEILSALDVAPSEYLGLLRKLRQVSKKESRGAEFLDERIECLQARLSQSDRHYWISSKQLTLLKLDNLVQTDERKPDGDRLYLRYDSKLAKVFAEDSLNYGPPVVGAVLISMTATEKHSVCAMAQIVARTAIGKKSPEIVGKFRRDLISWISSNSKETLNEVLSMSK